MAEVIGMPKLSDTMEEGQIASWLKKEGDTIDEGDPLVEIETDKATQEYESPEGGVILKILAQPGTTLKIGEPMAVVGEAGEKVDLDSLVGGKAKEEPASNVVEMRAGASKAAAKPAPAAPAPRPAAPAAAEPEKTGGRVKASPLARKMAQEAGLSLEAIGGSGPGGRIIMRDVQEALKGGVAAQPMPAAPMVAAAGDRRINLTMMRKTIAKRLVAGKNEAPHFYLTRSADMGRMLEWRKRLNAQAESRPDLAKISVNDLIILAVAKALRRHPVVNSSWQEDHILEHGDVHVAMAVALSEGLITPVIRHADQIGLWEIARQTKELTRRAKAGELKQEDYLGGTFTVSNLGMFGIEEFTAIINPPQAAILAVGATKPTPVVDENGQIVVRQIMRVTMSCDHRVVDGATGAEFLQTLVSYLEDPLLMLG